MTDPNDAALTRLCRGKRIVAVLKNTNGLLAIVLEDGSEVVVKWVNANGETLKGTPVVESAGYRLNTSGIRHLEGLRKQGAARAVDPFEPQVLQRQRMVSALQQYVLPMNYRT